MKIEEHHIKREVAAFLEDEEHHIKREVREVAAFLEDEEHHIKREVAAFLEDRRAPH